MKRQESEYKNVSLSTIDTWKKWINNTSIKPKNLNLIYRAYENLEFDTVVENLFPSARIVKSFDFQIQIQHFFNRLQKNDNFESHLLVCKIYKHLSQGWMMPWYLSSLERLREIKTNQYMFIHSLLSQTYQSTFPEDVVLNIFSFSPPEKTHTLVCKMWTKCFLHLFSSKITIKWDKKCKTCKIPLFMIHFLFHFLNLFSFKDKNLIYKFVENCSQYIVDACLLHWSHSNSFYPSLLKNLIKMKSPSGEYVSINYVHSSLHGDFAQWEENCAYIDALLVKDGGKIQSYPARIEHLIVLNQSMQFDQMCNAKYIHFIYLTVHQLLDSIDFHNHIQNIKSHFPNLQKIKIVVEYLNQTHEWMVSGIRSLNIDCQIHKTVSYIL